MSVPRNLTLLGAVMLAAACADTATEPIPVAEGFRVAADATLPRGNGVQLYNPNLSCESPPVGDVCRGVWVAAPWSDDSPVSVKTGSWVTLGFGVLAPSPTPEVTDALKAEVIDFIENDVQAELFFDGQEIPVVESVRWDQTTFEPAAVGYTATIPVRYFVIPQRPGAYVYEWKGALADTRTVSWVPKGKM